MNLNKQEIYHNLSEEKNNAEGTLVETKIDDGFYILTYQNEINDIQVVERHIESNYIQFHYCVKSSSHFVFNNGNYRLSLAEDNSLLLYNPQRNLPIHFEAESDFSLVTILISIKKFHGLFSQEADYISFLSDDNKDKKYYKDGKITPSMAIVLNQIINYSLNGSVKHLYFQGKALELLSLYFNRNEDADIEQCPFLADESNVIKIRKAKDIIIAQMAEPPTLQELSEMIGLSLKKLKEGFKQIYGDTVFSFLLEYKMEVARKLLESGNHNVNEVGLKIGYSTSSHFIAAFKKQYGTTPKKYLMGLTG